MTRSTGSLFVLGALAIGISFPASADDETFAQFRVLRPAIALEAAVAAQAECRNRGYQVAVSVVDRFGVLQVTLRDQLAGAHTPDTAFRKAWTAASFRTDTHELSTVAESGEGWGLRNVTNALPLGGGVQIIAGDGDMVGAIGVSGAPATSEDAACAQAGIDEIADKIAF